MTRVVREQTLVEDYNAMSTDLSRYKARGGKLLMYHGLADPIVTPQNTLDYYSAVEKAEGGSVTDYFRLFMIPGMDHCGLPGQAGPGITEAGFDPLTALEKWVEDGVAPDSMLATKARCNGTSPGRAFDVCFSDRPFGIKHFQTIHLCGVDVTRGLVFL